MRDWSLHAGEWSFAPYDPLSFEALPADAGWIPSLWPCRTSILGTVSFGGKTRRDLGDDWWTWYRWVPEKYRTQRSITFAFVATHHHFVLDRGGKVFKQSAPVIKLPADADERKHLELLGVLNSSTACFWMKQVFHNKGAGGGKRVEAGFAARGSEEWENHFEHDGTKLQAFPLARELDPTTAEHLDHLAQELTATSPEALAGEGVLSAERLTAAERRHRRSIAATAWSRKT